MPNGKPVERVLFVYTLVGRGGDAVQVLAMQEGLRRLGHRVVTIGPHSIRPYAADASTDRPRRLIKRLPWWLTDLLVIGLNLIALVKALAVALRFRPTLVLERATPYSLTGVLLSRLLRLPLIVHLDAPFSVERRYRGESMFIRLHQAVMLAVGRVAKLVVVGSEASRRVYADTGIPRERMIVLHNGVFKEDVRLRLDRPAGPPVVGFIGSMARWHGLDLLLDAVARLRTKGLDFSVQLVGAGEERSRLEERSKVLGLGPVVRFLGPVSRKSALSLIDGFHVAVLPNTLDTGSPMKLFEYAARGAAIVAPDLANLRAAWGEDAVAFFPQGSVEGLANALLVLLTDSAARGRLAHNARRRVKERFTWEQQLADLMAIAAGRRSF